MGTTLTKRMQAATSSTERLNFFKAPYDQKKHIAKAKLLPKGLYGCETSPINETAMRTWRATTATALTFTTTRRSVDLTYAVASGKTDLDPEVNVYVRRAVAARRAWHKNYLHKKNIEEITPSKQFAI